MIQTKRVTLFLALFMTLSLCAYFAPHVKVDDRICPNALHNIMQNGDQLRDSPKFREQIAKIDREVPIRTDAVSCRPLTTETVVNRALW